MKAYIKYIFTIFNIHSIYFFNKFIVKFIHSYPFGSFNSYSIHLLTISY